MKRNLHLVISAFVILVVALTYGITPNNTLPLLFDFTVDSTDLKNAFRATMGLYLAFSCYWVMGILKSEHWRAATISNVLFMGGLALGRIVSLLFEGLPSLPFTVGLILELLLMAWGILNLKKYTMGN